MWPPRCRHRKPVASVGGPGGVRFMRKEHGAGSRERRETFATEDDCGARPMRCGRGRSWSERRARDSRLALEVGQAARPISTGQLRVLLRFHTQPINLVVFKGSLGAFRPGTPSLEAGFPLRCFQRLSVPYMATRLCHWRDNRRTRGTSTQVLSYYGQLLSSVLRPRQVGTKLSHDVLNPARVPL